MACLLIRTKAAARFVHAVCIHRALPALAFAVAVSMATPFPHPRLRLLECLGFTVESILSATLIVEMVVLGDGFPLAWIKWKWMRFIGTIS